MKEVYVATSVADLSSMAESSLPPIDNHLKLILYFRSAQQILLQANIYKSEGDFEKAYIHMMKYSILILQKLPKHSQYSLPELQKEVSNAKQTVRQLLREMEGMKLVLQKQYDDEQNAILLRKKQEEDERLAIERENERRRKQEQLERAEEEARLRAHQEEQQKREYEKQQQWEMDVFAAQQLKKSQNSENTSPHLAVQAGMDNLKLQHQHNPPPTLQQEQLLPHDFFIAASLPPAVGNGDPPALNTQLASPQLSSSEFVLPQQPNFLTSQPTVDFLTPNPSSSTPETPGAPCLLDITPEDLSQPRPDPVFYSHLSALTPATKAVSPDDTTTVDYEKASVAYPDLYSDPIPSPSTMLKEHATNTKATKPYPPTCAHTSPPSPTAPPIVSTKPPPIAHSSHYMPPHPGFVFPTTFAPTYMPQHMPQPRTVQSPTRMPQPPSLTVQPPPLAAQPIINRSPAAPPTHKSTTSAHNSAHVSPAQARSRGRTDLEPSPSLPGISPDAPQSNTKLRKLVVYGEMFEAFMRVASTNTQRRIETCAILSGTLAKNVFHVTTMIVPKQEGTTDTCNATNEEELFEYQMANNLLTLGWIHTHPTQDCFLSSVDLHTHCTYQLLLPEAIAIVISPMHSPNFGIFRVSDPPGMQILQKCTLRGFHHHNDAETKGKALYTLCDHVDLIWGSKNFKIVDLR